MSPNLNFTRNLKNFFAQLHSSVTLSDNSEEYEVETILDKRTLKGKTQYLVKWIGYPLHDATWEPVTTSKMPT